MSEECACGLYAFVNDVSLLADVPSGEAFIFCFLCGCQFGAALSFFFSLCLDCNTSISLVVFVNENGEIASLPQKKNCCDIYRTAFCLVSVWWCSPYVPPATWRIF